MGSRLTAVMSDASDPGRVAHFWSGLLERDRVEDSCSVLLPGTDTQVGLRFVANGAAEHSLRRLHLHLTSASLADQQRTVATAFDLGGAHLDVGQRPEEGHIVLTDPEGNEFRVIEPGNSFLAGCGFLGEVACDGTRQVGRLWAEALSWPLVWDQDQVCSASGSARWQHCGDRILISTSVVSCGCGGL